MPLTKVMGPGTNVLSQIEKLDNHNYDVWCIQVKSVLVQAELWHVACGKLVKAATGDSNWEKQDEKALATLILSVKPPILRHIKNCLTSFEAWKKLKKLFQEAGPVRKVSLYSKLINLRMLDGGNAIEHMDDFSGLVDKLAEADVSLPDELVAIMLLSSLPSEYENFVVAMESRDKLPSVSFLSEKIIEENERRRQDSSNSAQSNGAQVYAADVCANNNNKGYKTKKDRKCFACGEIGHFAVNCRKKKKTKFDRTGKNEQKSFAILAATDTAFNSVFWCLDSGASVHLCCNKYMFSKLKTHNEKVILADDKYMQAEGIGEVLLSTREGDVRILDVLYVPGMKGNFLSVRKAVEKGYTVIFKNNTAVVRSDEGKVAIKAHLENGLFVFKNEQKSCCYAGTTENAMKWHARYGHLNSRSMEDLVTKNMVLGLERVNFPKDLKCITCLKCKIHVLPFPQSTELRAMGKLDLIHTDVCGPFKKPSLGGSRYYVTFIDDMSRRVFVYFIKKKDEVYDKFLIFKQLVERQTERKIKAVRSDNGREFVNKRFDDLFLKEGIQRQLTIPYTPQQNGVSERMNRTINEMTRTVLADAGVNEILWAEAVATAVYLKNRSPTKALDKKTPYVAWTGRKPSVSHLRVFGSTAVCLDKRVHNKMQPEGREVIMVGYSLNSKGYRLYDSQKRQVIEGRDVRFIEPTLPKCATTVNDFLSFEDVDTESQSPKTDNIEEDSPPIIEPVIDDVATETSTSDSWESAEQENLARKTDDAEAEIEEVVHDRYGSGRPRIIRSGQVCRPRKERHKLNVVKSSHDVDIPESVDEITQSKHVKEWTDAMHREYAALIKKKTWSLTNLPVGQRAIGCKWVFSVKRKDDGNIEKFKCRLVAKGCSQRYGVDYKETFSPVVRYATIRMLLALAVEKGLYVHHMDVCTAYLNSDLSDTVYMAQPEGFKDELYPDRVLKLNKAIYGLKQAGREWNAKLDGVLRQINFK